MPEKTQGPPLLFVPEKGLGLLLDRRFVRLSTAVNWGSSVITILGSSLFSNARLRVLSLVGQTLSAHP